MPAAATDFHVNGPTSIYWNVGGTADPSVELGKTDNDDLIRITFRDHYRTFSRNDTGDMIAESVLSGTTAVIDFTMVSWNKDELEKLLKRVRTGGSLAAGIANEGIFATVGGSTIQGALPKTISLKIDPTTVGETVYTFKNLMLTTGPEYIDFGNTLKRIAFSFTSVAATEVAVTSVKA
jgi:hypothetical protein